jgi:hypothetical protein
LLAVVGGCWRLLAVVGGCWRLLAVVVVVNLIAHSNVEFISGPLVHWWLQYIIQCIFYSGCDACGVWQDALSTSMARDGSCEIDPNGGLQLLLVLCGALFARVTGC